MPHTIDSARLERRRRRKAVEVVGHSAPVVHTARDSHRHEEPDCRTRDDRPCPGRNLASCCEPASAARTAPARSTSSSGFSSGRYGSGARIAGGLDVQRERADDERGENGTATGLHVSARVRRERPAIAVRRAQRREHDRRTERRAPRPRARRHRRHARRASASPRATSPASEPVTGDMQRAGKPREQRLTRTQERTASRQRPRATRASRNPARDASTSSNATAASERSRRASSVRPSQIESRPVEPRRQAPSRAAPCLRRTRAALQGRSRLPTLRSTSSMPANHHHPAAQTSNTIETDFANTSVQSAVAGSVFALGIEQASREETRKREQRARLEGAVHQRPARRTPRPYFTT